MTSKRAPRPKRASKRDTSPLELVYRAADEALAKADDRRAAAVALLKRLDRVPSLVPELLRLGVEAAIAHVLTTQRADAVSRPVANPDDTSGLRRRVLRAYEGLLGFPMADGQPLALSLRAEIARTGTMNISQSRTQSVRGAWLLSVAAGMPDDETPAGKVYTNDALLGLMRRAEGAE